MKFLSTLVLFILFGAVQAQADTIFYESFNDTAAWGTAEIDSLFENYDEDGISDYNGLPQNWFTGNFGNGGADSTERVALSSSWLANFNPGNRNHLRMPAIRIDDNTATLKWRSAPALGSLYMDGYTVLISTDPEYYYYIQGYDHDTLMHFAQNINDDSASFSTGVVHTSFDSTAAIAPLGINQYPGKLAWYEVSLADYAGQTVYIDFLHNSDDDNFIALDDITVLGNGAIATSMNEIVRDEVKLFPNPASLEINIDMSEVKEEIVNWRIVNMLGMICPIDGSISGHSMNRLNIEGLSNGIYFMIIQTETTTRTIEFVKE